MGSPRILSDVSITFSLGLCAVSRGGWKGVETGHRIEQIRVHRGLAQAVVGPEGAQTSVRKGTYTSEKSRRLNRPSWPPLLAIFPFSMPLIEKEADSAAAGRTGNGFGSRHPPCSRTQPL